MNLALVLSIIFLHALFTTNSSHGENSSFGRSSSRWYHGEDYFYRNDDFPRRERGHPFYRDTERRSTPKHRTINIVIPSPFDLNITKIVDPSASTSTPEPELHSGRISRSEAMCSEYKQAWSHSTNNSFVLPLVVNGRQAILYKYPHVVALGKEDEEKSFDLFCGGTLISHNWVLTAAHCTHRVLGGVTTVRLAVERLSKAPGRVIVVSRVVRHPSYKPPAMYADIALLELSESVDFERRIRPACLHQQYSRVPASAWICGWGAKEFGGIQSDYLQEAQLDLVDNVQCALRHNRSKSVPEGVVPSMLCAGAPRNNWRQDTCHGDSGGPLQITDCSLSPCMPRIIGITSFGAGCAFQNSPGIYTRVSHYLEWIEDVVWPRSD